MSRADASASDAAVPPGGVAASGRIGWTSLLTGYAIWVAALSWLAFNTANPPQLNLLQVSRATLLVTAAVTDLSIGRCDVEHSYSPGVVPDSLLVTNLSQTRAQPGTRYLLPLVRDLQGPEGSFRVVDLPDREIPPLIYPVSEEIVSRLTDWQRVGP